MEQGNEGDEIILFALRQIECNIPPDISSLNQLTPEMIIEIVVRSLWLITNGDAKFPITLPPNIATKHRICTSIAAKIKELGFMGECGYNQLLYPTAGNSRILLNWIVQKLPRSDDEMAEEVLGANALLNRRIMSTLAIWKSVPWRVPCVATGVPPRNIYDSQPFRTVSELTAGALPLFAASSAASAGISDPILRKRRRAPVECSVFERHAMQLLQEAAYAARLESDFSEDDAVKGSSSVVKNAFRQALASARQQQASSASSSAAGVGSGVDRDGNSMGSQNASSRSREAVLMGMNFNDMLSSLTEDVTAGGTRGVGGDRSSRFALAAEFSQESSTVMGSSSNVGESSYAFTSEEQLLGQVAGMKQSGVESGFSQEGLSTDSATPSVLSRKAARVSAESAARKAKQELEEKEREDELEALKAQLLTAGALADALNRHRSDGTNKVRQLESEVSSLHSASEEVERDIVLKRKTLEMLPSAADNISALQNICAASAKKLMQLAQEWETHRRPLIESLREVNSRKARRRAQCRQMVEGMKRYRSEMVTMMQDLKDKQERAQVLNEELSKMPKNLNRTLYTYRIMDIIASIGKQNQEINKITSDIRDIQKSINTTTSTLQRADAIAEDKIYGAANDSNNDQAMIEAYRQLRNLRAKFEELVGTVNKIGVQDKQAADLETKIEQETTRVSANNSDRIRTDLEQVRGENAQLVAQIKRAGASSG